MKDFIFGIIESLNLDKVDNIVTFVGTLLDKKVDGEYIENPEYFHVYTDATKRIVEATKKDGMKLFPAGIDFVCKEQKPISNEEWIDVLTDRLGRVINGTRKNGDYYFKKSTSAEELIKKFLQSFKDKELTNEWTKKKIAWYGTSIPMGADNLVPMFAPNRINAYIRFGVMQTYEKAGYLPSEYPVIAASILGVDTVYNMSQGSSRITRNVSGTNLTLRCLSLGNTVLENINSIWGSYNIDITNKTFSRNLDNTVGITTFFASQYESSWNNFANHILLLISQSYEIRLMAYFLIKDPTLHNQHITRIFGDYYNTVSALLASVDKTMGWLTDYKDDVSLIVLEHSVNDVINVTVPVDSDDIDTFAGSYNKIVNLIRFYRPEMRLAIVSNYMDFSTEQDIIPYLGKIAQRWSIPFIDMRGYSQVSPTIQQTQGYWDVNGYWHNDGFTWIEDVANDSYTTNCTFPAAISSPSLAQMKQNVNPHQVNGTWCWESPLVYQWCADGLHPNSDKGGRLTMLIGKVLAEFLKDICDYQFNY